MLNFNLTTKTQSWVLTGLGSVIALAAFLPWVSVAFFSVNGVAGDGKITLVAGLLLAGLGVLTALRPEALPRIVTSILTAVFGGAAAAVVVWDLISLSTALTSEADSEFEQAIMSSVSPGVGLILTGILGAAAFAFGTFGVISEYVTQPEPVVAA